MGGAGFPTHVKLAPKDPSAIDYIIANCAECEPYLTSDYRQMVEHPGGAYRRYANRTSAFPDGKGCIRY